MKKTALVIGVFVATLLALPNVKSAHAAGPNLVPNPSFETGTTLPTSWTRIGWSTSNRPTFTYPVAPVEGAKAVRVTEAAYVRGDVGWGSTAFNVVAGTTYNLTEYSKSNVASTVLAVMTRNGRSTTTTLGTVTGNNAWQLFSKSIVIPAGTTKVAIQHVLRRNGTLDLDAFSFATPDQFALTVTKAGTGTGTVIATGINCGADCTEMFNAGTVVAVTVSPTAGSTFAGWSGACTGTGACNVTMSAAQTVTATFNLAAATGLPVNGNFETVDPANAAKPLAWNSSFWGTMTPTFTYPTPGKTGNGAKVTVAGYTSGDAKWYFDPITSSSGRTYTFSFDYTSTIASNISIEYHLSDGTLSYGWLGDPPASAAWTTYSGQFTIPSGATSFTFYTALVGNGSLTVDNYSITETTNGGALFANGMVTLEFDDTLATQYTVARPMLNTAGLKSSFYAITDAGVGIGSDSDYMTWAQVTQLKADGHEIGAHTRTHPDLTTLTTAQAFDEINGSKQDLIAHGISPVTFVYPFGQLNAAIKQQVKDAGFIGARTVFDGFNFKTSDKFAMLDKHIESTTTVADVQGWINQAVANKTWLIMELHEQTTTPGPDTGVYYNTPTTLQGIINAIKASTILNVTMAQGIALMNP